MKKRYGKEKVGYTKNRSKEAEGRKEIIVKKVIISARGFAVARTTNKAEPVGRCAQQRRLKREKLCGERERTRAENYCAHQQDNFWESVNVMDNNSPQ